MLYLSNKFSNEKIKEIIEKEADIKVHSITLLDNGWDNVAFDINNEYIFRFPKGHGTNFDVELKLLQILKGKTTIPIPNPEFIGGDVAYMGYKKLLGRDLTPELYGVMTDEQKDKLAADYAQFAFEIHNALSLEQAKKLGVKIEDSFKHVPTIEAILTQEKFSNFNILTFAKETLDEYTKTVDEKELLSFIYGDLHTENIAFDPVTKQLNGIFDFGDACIADIHFEFAPIYKFSTELLESTVAKYETLTNMKLSLRKIVLRGRMNELGDLTEFIDQPDSEIYLKAMRRMSQWIKEKDIYK